MVCCVILLKIVQIRCHKTKIYISRENGKILRYKIWLKYARILDIVENDRKLKLIKKQQ